MKNKYDPKQFGLVPKHPFMKIQSPIVSDELPLALKNGKIILKPGITSFHAFPLPFVLFEDGSIETGLDYIIMNTGFSLEFPSKDKLVDVRTIVHFV